MNCEWHFYRVLCMSVEGTQGVDEHLTSHSCIFSRVSVVCQG